MKWPPGSVFHLGDVLKRVPLGYFSQNSVGDILAGVTTELSTLELQGMKMVDVIINGYAKFIAIVLCLIFFSPVAAVISIVGVALSALALQGISRHSEKKRCNNHIKQWKICPAQRLNTSEGFPL